MRSRGQEKETVAAVFSGTYSDTIFAPDYAIFIYCLIVLHDFPGNLEACSRFVQHCNNIVCVTLSIIKSETRNLHMHLKFANFISGSDQQKSFMFWIFRILQKQEIWLEIEMAERNVLPILLFQRKSMHQNWIDDENGLSNHCLWINATCLDSDFCQSWNCSIWEKYT